MPSTCTVTFDNPTGIYYSGQEVSGTVDLTTTNEKSIRGIEVKILGYARAWCYQKHGKRRMLYHGEEHFLNSGGCVVGEEDGSSFSFEPGTYSYPFKSTIPTKAPSTFEGQYGVIRYIVHIKIFRNLMYDNLFKVPFVVVLPLDLNSIPKLRMPSCLDDTKVFSCPCWASGSMEVKLSTPMTGYVPGQPVFFKAIIDNESNYNTNDINIGILQRVSYEMTHPNNKKQESEYKLIKKEIGPIHRQGRKEVTDSLIMPVAPPSTIDTNTIIVICYFLYLQIDFGCCNDDFVQLIPLTVGVIPLYNTSDGQNIVDYEISHRHYPPPDSATPMRPPVFKEYVQDKENPIQTDPLDGLIDENQVKEYVIKYPFYEDLPSNHPGDW